MVIFREAINSTGTDRPYTLSGTRYMGAVKFGVLNLLKPISIQTNPQLRCYRVFRCEIRMKSLTRLSGISVWSE